MFEHLKNAFVKLDDDISEEISNKDNLGKYLLNQLTHHLEDWCYEYRYSKTYVGSHHDVSFIHKQSGFKFYYNANQIKVELPFEQRISITGKFGDKISNRIMDIFNVEDQKERYLIKYLKSDLHNSVTVKFDDIYSIKRWLDENITGVFNIHFEDTILTIWFEDPEDAIHFKMVHTEGLVEKKPIVIEGYEF